MVDPRDIVGQDDFDDVVVLLPSGESLVGLSIRGWGEPAILGVRHDADGAPVSCAVVDSLAVDHHPAQNPRRYPKAWPIPKDEE